MELEILKYDLIDSFKDIVNVSPDFLLMTVTGLHNE